MVEFPKAWWKQVRQQMRADSPMWRKLAYFGASSLPEPFVRNVPSFFGALFWAVCTEHRRGVHHNQQVICGERPWWEEQWGSFQTFAAFAHSLTEGFAAMGPRENQVKFTINGQEHFDRLVEKKSGAIFLTAHTSGFELAGAALSKRFSIPMVMVMDQEPNRQSRAISDEVRKRAGLEVLHMGDNPFSILSLAARVRAGSIVALQLDRLPPGMRAVDVSFFGQPTSMPLGPFWLARVTQAPLVVVFTRRIGFFEVLVEAHPPIYLDKRCSEQDIAPHAQQVADSFASWVRSAPEEWFDWGVAARRTQPLIRS
jgi:phosphatidylinositol dimannoside acyltransferase